jgi:3-hydroxyisobutyrate dehydrogenase-like beta-hydroxyacid dehydrogenase
MTVSDTTGAGVPRVGVIGLGEIGRGLTNNLLQAGVTLSLFDIRPEAIDPFALRAQVAATPGAVAASSEVVLVAVVDDAQVRQVLEGPEGVFAQASPGTAVVVVSTIAVTTVRELHAAGATHGVAVVDCGVSGSRGGADKGTLICMVGGTPDDVERVRPVLDLVSGLVLHMGPSGAGLSAKLARNLVQYGSWLAAFEAQQLAEAAGIDLLTLGQAIKESDKLIGGPAALMFRSTAAPWPADADAGLVAAMRAGSQLARKDLAAARALGAELHVPLTLAAMAEERCDLIFGFSGPA